MIEKISIGKFTAFKKLDLTLSKGINVFVGANGTGKSHLLKLAYGFCTANKPMHSDAVDKAMDQAIASAFTSIFQVKELRSLCREKKHPATVSSDFVFQKRISLEIDPKSSALTVTGDVDYEHYSWEAAFIPPKEVLSIYPGFVSLYDAREIAFDSTYRDLCQAVARPVKRKISDDVQSLLKEIEKACGGIFELEGDTFNFKPTVGSMITADLVAEGFRKVGIIHLLLRNGIINPGVSGPLFWDEPESNLNPSMMKVIVKVLLALAKHGQQILLATHDYVLLKELDLQMEKDTAISFHALYRKNKKNGVEVESTTNYLDIHPNAIADTFSDLYNRDVKRALEGDK